MYAIKEATLVGHHGTGKIMRSGKSIKNRESHLIKKEKIVFWMQQNTNTFKS